MRFAFTWRPIKPHPPWRAEKETFHQGTAEIDLLRDLLGSGSPGHIARCPFARSRTGSPFGVTGPRRLTGDGGWAAGGNPPKRAHSLKAWCRAGVNGSFTLARRVDPGVYCLLGDGPLAGRRAWS